MQQINKDWRRLGANEMEELNTSVPGPTQELPTKIAVVIVGAGPIGLLAANLLGQLSVAALVIEKSEETSSLPKAIVLDDEAVRAHNRVGLGDVVGGSAEPFGIHFIAANGKPIVQANGFVTPNGFGNRNSISQPEHEKKLLRGLKRFDMVKVAYKTELVSFEQRDESVRLIVRGPHGQSEIQADYLLGCDGANSFVRKSLGLDFDGKRINQPHLVVDLADFPDSSPYSRFFCKPERPFNSIPGPYGGRRIEFMLNPNDDLEMITDPRAVRDLVDRHTPYAGVPLHILRVAVYGFSARIAQRFSIGRVFLLGDAAHVMPPFGAQGLNSGSRDAVNLCWKLGMVLSGRAGSRLLDSYDSERRLQALETVKYSVAVGRIANIRSHFLASIRNAAFAVLNRNARVRDYFAHMRYMPLPRIIKGAIIPEGGGRKGWVGKVFPQIGGLGPKQDQTFDQFVGSGFALVGVGVSENILRSIAQQSPWTDIAPVLVALDITDAIGRKDAPAQRLAQIAACHSGEILIVRPDRYIAASMSPACVAMRSQEFAHILGVSQLALDGGPQRSRKSAGARA